MGRETQKRHKRIDLDGINPQQNVSMDMDVIKE